MINLYKEELLDHYRHPRNAGILKDADITAQSGNPACGDQVSFTLKLDQQKKHITQIKFSGHGCVISQATASMLTELVLHKSLTEILAFTKDTMLDLIHIQVGLTRMRCVLLSLDALQTAIQTFVTSS